MRCRLVCCLCVTAPIKKPKGKLAVGSAKAKVVDRVPRVQAMLDKCKEPLIGTVINSALRLPFYLCFTVCVMILWSFALLLRHLWRCCLSFRPKIVVVQFFCSLMNVPALIKAC